MKKPILFLIIIALLAMASYQLKACQQGEVGYQVTFTYGSPSCSFTIYYCTYTTQAGTWIVYVDYIMGQLPCSADYIDDPGFWQRVNLELYNSALDNGTFPPCPDVEKMMQIEFRLCWKAHNVVHPNWYLELLPCEQTIRCVTLYGVCIDYSKNPPEKKVTKYYSETMGDGSCEEEWPQLPPPGKTWYEEWYTDCFLVFCTLP